MKKLIIFEEWEFEKLKIKIIGEILDIFIKKYNLNVDLNPKIDSNEDKFLDTVLDEMEKSFDREVENSDN